MKKFGAILMGILLVIGLLSGCSSTEKNVKTTKAKTTQEDNKNTANAKSKDGTNKNDVQKDEKSLTDLVNFFKSKGFTMGEVTSKYYGLINAKDGFGIDIDGNIVEFYQFDPNNESAKKNIEDAKTIGKVDMSGMSVPVIFNNNFILASYEDHPEKDKIINTFKEFK